MEHLKAKLAACLVIAPLCGAAIGGGTPITLDEVALDAVTAGGTRVSSNEIDPFCGAATCPGYLELTVQRRVISLVDLHPSLKPRSNEAAAGNAGSEQQQTSAAARLAWNPVWSKRSDVQVLSEVSSTRTVTRPTTVSAASLLLGR